ncbi:MAG: beta-propeller fold lactonase family protein [Pyrinomonadaceae bacterium]
MVGSGPNVDRQTKPHAHFIILDQADAHAYAADLGLDKLLIYDFDKKRGKLAPHNPPFASVKLGAGPRHFTFHPSQKYAYVINELDSTITAFTFDPKSATLKEIHTLSTLPPDFQRRKFVR